jgi:hypothetical protein
MLDATAADVPHRQRMRHAERRTDDQDFVTDLDGVRIAQGGDRGLHRRSLELNQRKVGGRLRSDDPRRQRLSARELDRDRIGDLHDVRRGEHAVLVYEDPRAEAGFTRSHLAGPVGSLTLGGPDHDDGIRHPFEDLAHRLRPRGNGDRDERHHDHPSTSFHVRSKWGHSAFPYNSYHILHDGRPRGLSVECSPSLSTAPWTHAGSP